MLHPHTLGFLRNLSQHNTREWFEAQRDAYDAARKDFAAFTDALREKLLPVIPALATQEAKDLTFRLFRDVRFSKDKRPYKTNMGAYFSRGGKKAPDAGFYLHAEPDTSFLAAGLWMPEGPLLKGVRQEIDYGYDEFRSMVEAPAFRKAFPKWEGESLKKPPAGYAPDHPGIEVLKRKSFIVVRPLSDADLEKKEAPEALAKLCATAAPLVDFLNRAIL